MDVNKEVFAKYRECKTEADIIAAQEEYLEEASRPNEKQKRIDDFFNKKWSDEEDDEEEYSEESIEEREEREANEPDAIQTTG